MKVRWFFKCVRKPTNLKHHANKASRWADKNIEWSESPWNQSAKLVDAKVVISEPTKSDMWATASYTFSVVKSSNQCICCCCPRISKITKRASARETTNPGDQQPKNSCNKIIIINRNFIKWKFRSACWLVSFVCLFVCVSVCVSLFPPYKSQSKSDLHQTSHTTR